MDNFPGGIRLTHIEFSDIICVMNQMMSVLGSLITNARYGLRTTFVVLRAMTNTLLTESALLL